MRSVCAYSIVSDKLRNRKSLNLRLLNVTESCSLDFEPVIALFGGFPNLIPDVFAFSIAICPDTQCTRISCLFFDILSYLLLVL